MKRYWTCPKGCGGRWERSLVKCRTEGSANDETALSLVKWLVDQAPDTLASDTDSVRLFIEGIRGIGGSVSTESPSGAYAEAT